MTFVYYIFLIGMNIIAFYLNYQSGPSVLSHIFMAISAAVILVFTFELIKELRGK